MGDKWGRGLGVTNRHTCGILDRYCILATECIGYQAYPLCLSQATLTSPKLFRCLLKVVSSSNSKLAGMREKGSKL